MSIWQRLKNLWNLSGLEVHDPKNSLPRESKVMKVIKKNRMATIVDLSDEVELD